jgi:site-specific DNA-methyltransferase (adenine-specific)
MNTLWHGDNLPVLRGLAAESVDLVYLDPPFKSDQNYNMLYRERDGTQAAAQIQAFSDTWTWDSRARLQLHNLLEAGGQIAETMEAFRQILGYSDMLAYLVMMAPRLVELRRVLKSTGSLYLHCDDTASHYLKVLLDAVFSPAMFRAGIVWKRTTSHNDARRNFGDVVDILLYYAKTDSVIFNAQYGAYDPAYLASKYRYLDQAGRRYRLSDLRSPHPRPNLTYDYRGHRPHPNGWAVSIEKMKLLDDAGRLEFPKRHGGRIQLRRYLDERSGMPVSNVWDDIRPVNAMAEERLGYPTQKPEALLDRVLRASSNEGGTLLDPFCGCGTTIASAQRLGRRWIGIDVTHLAIEVICERLGKLGLREDRDYKVDGRHAPRTIPDIDRLAKRSKHEFQGWALEQAGIEGFQLKPGPDRGVDGRKVFFDPPGSDTRRELIVSVKGGQLKANDVRDLIGAVLTHRGDIGVLIALREPTPAMKRDAASLAPYEAADGKRYPRIQILTVKQLLAGHTVEYPLQLVYTQPTVALPANMGPRKISQPGLLREEQLELRAPRPKPVKAHLRAPKPRRLVAAKRK